MESIDCVVVGAGVVGLAVARALALAGREVLVIEAADGIGTETSSRNSEVIHAGIYYPAGSLMARFCVAGRRALYAYCAEKHVPHLNCGKLIVATNAAEDARLADIRKRAAVNGVDDMRILSRAEALALEPNLNCTSALLSPSTGILDSHAFMVALQGDAENAGALVVFRSPVQGGRAANGHIEIDVGGDESMRLACNLLVNSAGLHAPAFARTIAGMPAERIPTAYYARGNYFSISAGRRFPASSTRCRCRAASASTSRSTSAARRGSAPTSSGSTKSTTASIPAAPTASTRRCGPTGPTSGTAPCNPAMPASARRSRPRAPPPRISSSRARRRTGCPD